MLAGGLGALLGFIGTQLSGATPACWRILLSLLLGRGLVAVAAALLLTVTIEGGRRMTRLNLREVVTTYNSVEAYQAAEAAAALKRLDTSKKVAGVGAVLAFLGLQVTLWIPAPPGDPASVPQYAPTTSKPLVPPTP